MNEGCVCMHLCYTSVRLCVCVRERKVDYIHAHLHVCVVVDTHTAGAATVRTCAIFYIMCLVYT